MSPLRPLAAAAALAAASAALPPFGPLDGIFPLANTQFSPRHCTYQASVMQVEDGNEDFEFVLVPSLNGNANVSLPAPLLRALRGCNQ
jgi:hypothetical protein